MVSVFRSTTSVLAGPVLAMDERGALLLDKIAPPPRRLPPGERVYAIGDIHGRLDLFERLLGMIRRDNATRTPAHVQLVLLGDLIDRGPESAELVRRCMKFAEQTNQFVVLKGNHEAIMVESLSGDFAALSLWLEFGGDAALSSWGIDAALIEEGASTELLRTARSLVPKKTLAWLRKLPLTWQSGDYLFVHAGIRPGVELAQQMEEDLLWIRGEFLGSDTDHACLVVHGHSISEHGVVVRNNRIGIDTGAYRTGILSALAIEGDQHWTLATPASLR